MAESDEARADALELITEFGETATLRTLSNASPPDANKPWRAGAVSSASLTILIAIVAASGNTLQYQEGEVTRTGKWLGIVAAPLTTEPDLGSEVLRSGGEVLLIKRIKKHTMQGVVVAYEMVLDT